jgi:small subunit ribosomal protein S14
MSAQAPGRTVGSGNRGMVKKSEVVKDNQHRTAIAHYVQRCAQLKEIIRSSASMFEQRLAAQRALTCQPRDASPRWLRRCEAIDGSLPGYRGYRTPYPGWYSSGQGLAMAEEI